MRQIAEHLVERGHEVIVVTTRLANRTFREHNGVHIEEFNISGNLVRGMSGEVDRYRKFVISAKVDAILIKAAQQWTFDALWPVVEQIRARKVFIPCGFSGLYQSIYANYFERLPKVLRSLDHLIFYASKYRDIKYVRAHGIKYFSIVPNGASEIEFSVSRDVHFRKRHGIPEDSFLFLTVGSLTGIKGHLEVAKAFAGLDAGERRATLILNGNVPIPPRIIGEVDESADIRPDMQVYRKKLSERTVAIKELMSVKGWPGLINLVLFSIIRRFDGILPSIAKNLRLRFVDPLGYWIMKATSQSPFKQVLKVDLPREELVQAYKNANLFVFASNVEYSPLVLFESAAAGTPFLSVPVGNAEEIAEWTGCGIIVQAPIDQRGFTRPNPHTLAAEMRKAMDSPQLLAELGRTGYEHWQERYTWAKICLQYEKVLAGHYE